MAVNASEGRSSYEQRPSADLRIPPSRWEDEIEIPSRQAIQQDRKAALQSRHKQRSVKETIMQLPLEITFRNMDPSPSVEEVVRDKSSKLERFFDRIVSCNVTIEAPHRHQHKGKLYKVRIDIGMPGKDVHVNQEGPKNQAHEDVYVAIRDAFDAAARQVEDYARRLRGDVKTHTA
jgi:ribosomal subunit interface protein